MEAEPIVIMTYWDYFLAVVVFWGCAFGFFMLNWLLSRWHKFTDKMFANLKNKRLAEFLRWTLIGFVLLIIANILVIPLFYQSLPFKDTLDKILSFI
ncbi:hypothetical protein CCY99_08360 [Helicobacter sp. 16-1353]|uniref:hypothetical protein n=1 Tax=Helicobacter sp. 16-1353 TaxID=2004996 RepID=UPI000DCEA269|nr:hypothetical protein [Helicobacter sp. 16-1353]RAX51803.1 hypothetical protein CCY99_08360 [Helicobacter sp. 16-1353]